MITNAGADQDADMTINVGAAEAANTKPTTMAQEGGFLQAAGVGPSAGGFREIVHPAVPHEVPVDVTAPRDCEDGEEDVEAKVQDLSLRVYAPTSHALVVKVRYRRLGMFAFGT